MTIEKLCIVTDSLESLKFSNVLISSFWTFPMSKNPFNLLPNDLKISNLIIIFPPNCPCVSLRHKKNPGHNCSLTSMLIGSRYLKKKKSPDWYLLRDNQVIFTISLSATPICETHRKRGVALIEISIDYSVN